MNAGARAAATGQASLMRMAADELRGRAAGLERWRAGALPHAASLMLDCVNRMKGTAQGLEALAAELEHPTPADQATTEGTDR